MSYPHLKIMYVCVFNLLIKNKTIYVYICIKEKKDPKWAIHEMLIAMKIHIIFHYFLCLPQRTCVHVTVTTAH